MQRVERLMFLTLARARTHTRLTDQAILHDLIGVGQIDGKERRNERKNSKNRIKFSRLVDHVV